MKFTGERFIPGEVDENDEINYEHYNRYKLIQDFVNNKIILDAACGVGYGSKILSKTAKEVYSIDIDVEAIDFAKENYQAKNINFVQSSVTQLPFENEYFEVIVSFETIEHLNQENQEVFLSEIKRVLKKDGVLIMSTPDKNFYLNQILSHNHYHLNEFNADEFNSFLKEKFIHIDFLYQRNEVCHVISEANNIVFYDNSIIESNDTPLYGKYLIGICSDVKIDLNNLSLIQVQIEDYNNKIKRILDVQDEIEEKNEWASNLNDEIISLRSDINIYQTEIESNSNYICKLQENINSLEQAIALKIEDIASLKADKKNSEELYTKLNEEKEKLNDNLKSSDQVIVSKLEEIASLKADKKNSEELYTKLNEEKEKLNDNLKSSDQVIVSKLEEIASLKADKKNSEELYTKLNEEKEKLNDNLKSSDQVIVSKLEEIASLKADKKNSEELYTKLNEEKEKLNDNLKSSQQVLASKLDEIITLKKTLRNIEISFTELVENKNVLQEEKLLIQNESEIQGIELNSLKQVLFAKNKELEELIYKANLLQKQLVNMKHKSEKNFYRANNIEAFHHLKYKHSDRCIKSFLKENASTKNVIKPIKLVKSILNLKRELQYLNNVFNRVPRGFLDNFDASSYLSANDDVIIAIENGEFENALEHIIFFGLDEISSGLRVLNNLLEPYSESKYLDDNRDVKSSVERGSFSTGFDHYLVHGYNEIIHGTRYWGFDHNKDIDLKIIDPEEIVISYNNVIHVPKFDKPLVSIVIPVFNQAKYTLACISSIIENTSTIPYEIIIMDDNSTEEDALNIKYFINNITFISNEKNLGFLLNCNKGAGLAKGQYVLFLNNDTNVQPNWLSSLVELIESNTSIGMVGSRLIYPDGRQQEAGGIIWDDASGWNYGRLDDPLKPEYNYVKEVDYISGAAIMISKPLWDEIGGFDEKFKPAYYEDADLAFEVRRRGYKVMFQPKSVVIHYEGISNGIDLGSGIKQYQKINFKKFHLKWENELKSNHFPNAKSPFLARDRSRFKPHVLFIDHYIPHFDQDAGSKATYQYLKILIEAGMTVHFIGDNFWHYPGTPYLESLTKMGIEVLYGNWYAKNWQGWLSENGQFLDYVILARPHISVNYIDLVKKYSNAKTIYMGHDLHFLREKREYDIKKEEKYLLSSQKWKKDELELMKKVDVSYYFSSVEKEVILNEYKDLNVDVVPLYIYEKFNEVSYNTRLRKDIMFVGGFGHAPNVDAIEWFVEEIWPRIYKKNENIHFYIIGSKPTKEILKLANKNITVTGYISDQELDEYYEKCRIVVAPLRFGAGVKGKIIDSLYNGVPLVTTTVGAEGIPFSKDIMKIADSTSTFAEAVNELYNNDSLLEELSHKGLELCKKFYSKNEAIKQMSKSIDFLRNEDSKSLFR